MEKKSEAAEAISSDIKFKPKWKLFVSPKSKLNPNLSMSVK